MTTAGTEIRAIRAELGLTQTQLGELMGMRPNEICRLENGHREPTKIQLHFIRMIRRCYGATAQKKEDHGREAPAGNSK
jgi:transcriptional regulator with XRE-family HTH domain